MARFSASGRSCHALLAQLVTVAFLALTVALRTNGQQQQHSFNPFAVPMVATLFSEEGFLGAGAAFTTEEQTTLHRLGEHARTVRSVQLTTGLQVELYGDETCTQPILTLRNPARSLTALGVHSPIYCARVTRLSERDGVIVYSDAFYSGLAQFLSPGTYTAGGIGDRALAFDNAISSIWMASSWRVVLYEGDEASPNLASNHATSITDLSNVAFNDMASTVIVTRGDGAGEEDSQTQQPQYQQPAQAAQDESDRGDQAAEQAWQQAMVEAAEIAARQQHAANAAAPVVDIHMRELLAWQSSQSSPKDCDPFLGPAYATLYEHDDYVGRSSRVECCDPFIFLRDDRTGEPWEGVSSLRVTAGTRVLVYESGDCTGPAAPITFVANNPSFSRSAWPHLNDHVGCVRLERVDPAKEDGIVVLFPDAGYKGEGQLVGLGLTDASQLYQDNAVSSVWFPSTTSTSTTLKVTLHDAPQHHHAHAASMVLTHSVENLSVFGFNDLLSSVVVEHSCDPSCGSHGQCEGGRGGGQGGGGGGWSRCRCEDGWAGPACDTPLPDATSFVACDRREYFRGENMNCAIHPRRDSQNIHTRRGAFHLRPLIAGVPATAEGADTGIVWARTDDHLASKFEFIFRAGALSPGLRPQVLLEARVNLRAQFSTPASGDGDSLPPDAMMEDLPPTSVPSVTVFGYPDGSSTLDCSKRRGLLMHERVTCTIHPRAEGVPLTTLTRAFEPRNDPDAETCAKIGKIVAVQDSKGKNKKKQKNDRVGSTFTFSYTPLSIPHTPSGKNTLSAVCTWSSSTSASSLVPPCFPALSLGMNHAPPSETDYFGQAKQLVFESRFSEALPLLLRALRSQPDHTKEVLLLRADLLVLFGRYKQARRDLQTLQRMAKGERVELPSTKKKVPSSAAPSATATRGEDEDDSSAAPEPVASESLLRLESSKPDPALARRVSSKRALLQSAESEQNRGMLSHAMSSWAVSVGHLSTALETSRYSIFLHLLRAECALHLGEYNLLKYDVVSVLNLQPFNPQAIHLLSKGYYQILGNLPTAIINLKLCMRHAPSKQSESRDGDKAAQMTPCEKTYLFYIQLADAAARVDELAGASAWAEAAQAAEDAMDLDRSGPSARNMLYKACGHYARANSTNLHAKTVSVCSDALRTLKDQIKMRDKDGGGGGGESSEDRVLLFSLTLDRGFAFFGLGKHEAALGDLKYCIGLGATPGGPEMAQRMDLLNALLNRAKESRPLRDLYEVLGVERDASKQEIKRAYRRLALQYHPDKNDALEAAEMFLEMTEAFAILYDDETRAKYDSGIGGEALRKEQQQQQQQARRNFNFNFGEYTEDGRVKAWFTNAEGEEEWTEFETQESQQRKQQEDAEKKAKSEEEKKKEIPKHCCLPLGQGE